MQPTWRDGRLVNLPWILLVTGDLIQLQPGREAPCSCEEVTEDAVRRRRRFSRGMLYAPAERQDPETGCVLPSAPMLCRVLETPAAGIFSKLLSDGAKSNQAFRPTFLQRELDKVIHSIVERRILPAAAFVALLILVCRHVLLVSNVLPSHLLSTDGYFAALRFFLLAVLPVLSPAVSVFLWLVDCAIQADVLRSTKEDTPRGGYFSEFKRIVAGKTRRSIILYFT